MNENVSSRQAAIISSPAAQRLVISIKARDLHRYLCLRESPITLLAVQSGIFRRGIVRGIAKNRRGTHLPTVDTK